MKMEELENNSFIKGPDTVEKHLLDIVQKYFESNGGAGKNSQEYIINLAVKRMKAELNIDNAGVVSINGKTGDVILDCTTIGAEPAILDKKTAFNVDFGNVTGTVCQGDDPRLSDKRTPKPHTHNMSEINGLSGEISNIKNLINMLTGSGHAHDNKPVLDKIIYTGSSNTINLDTIEECKTLVDNKIAEVDSLISTYTASLDALLQSMQNRLDNA